MIDNIDELFKLYYRPLCLYSLHYVADIDLAEDIVQDCFAELWQRICMNSDITNIKQYMYSMVRNKSIDSLRKESLIDHDIQISDIGSYIFDDIIIWDRQQDYNNMRPLGYPYKYRINKVHEYILIFIKQ